MSSSKENIEFRYSKPSKLLDDFVHIYWEHKNISGDANILNIFPDSFFKLIFLFQKEKLVAYFMTGLWTDEMEFKTPPNTTIYGVKFKILAPEYIFQNEVATILQSHKDLSPDFLNLRELDFCNFESFVEQIESLFSKRVIQNKKRIKTHKLQLSQLLYMVNGNISVDEVSKQINWSNRQINRYLNKYLGVSLKTYLNIQKCYSSYFHIRDGEFYPVNEYFDQSHFIREIKKHTGKTPKELYKSQNDHFIQLKFIQRK